MTEQKNDVYETYKKFIDDCVETAREGGLGSQMLRSRGLNDPIDYKVVPSPCTFMKDLSNEQIVELAAMLKRERISAFHDCLVILSDCVNMGDITLMHHNEVMPTGVEGDMFDDFMGFIVDPEWKWRQKPPATPD